MHHKHPRIDHYKSTAPVGYTTPSVIPISIVNIIPSLSCLLIAAAYRPGTAAANDSGRTQFAPWFSFDLPPSGSPESGRSELIGGASLWTLFSRASDATALREPRELGGEKTSRRRL